MSADAAPTQARSIFHPVVDTVFVAGASLLLMVWMLAIEPALGSDNPLAMRRFLLLAVVLNWPHFGISYRLLYGSAETVRAYPWSAKWVPLGLGIYALAAAGIAHITPLPLNFMTWVAAVYLAWHYTGQTWGMMASFSFLDGMRFEADERRLVVGSLRLLLVFHVAWALYHGTESLLPVPPWLFAWFGRLYVLAAAGVAVAAVLGGVGLARYSRRHGRLPPVRVLAPYLLIYLWYALLARTPVALFWVQMSHSLQYMLFPLRVETNREAAKRGVPASQGSILRGVVLPWAVLIAISATPFLVVSALSSEGGSSAWWMPWAVALSAFINIHHYFLDGAIWKISNPSVRKELFAHHQA